MFLFQFIASLFSNLIPLVGAINNQAFPDPLTPEEEEYYLNQMAQGDKGAREKLIEHNLTTRRTHRQKISKSKR